MTVDYKWKLKMTLTKVIVRNPVLSFRHFCLITATLFTNQVDGYL